MLAPALADSSIGINPALFERLADWEEGNFWFVPRNRLIIGLLTRHFPAAESIMEIGCASGFVLSEIAKLKPWRRFPAIERHSHPVQGRVADMPLDIDHPVAGVGLKPTAIQVPRSHSRAER